MTNINIDTLRELCTEALSKTGLPQHDIDITVDHYLENECMGKSSHGMVRVVGLVSALKKYSLAKETPQFTKDCGNILTIDGNKNIAPSVSSFVLEESIKRAKEHGISFVGGSNYIGNTGSMAYYLRRLAKQGLIAFMSCNSVATVCAPAGKESLIGTNPIGLCVPSENGEHFIADFATSAIAYGKVLVAVDKNKELPEDCIIDANGNPSTNPNDAFPDGSIRPLADYRGFALGLFVEMIALMFGADVLSHEHYGKDAIFIIAIDPSKLSDGYATRVSNILDYIRNSPPAPGHDSVSIPGDRSATTLKTTLERGTVDVADKTLQKLKQLAS